MIMYIDEDFVYIIMITCITNKVVFLYTFTNIYRWYNAHHVHLPDILICRTSSFPTNGSKGIIQNQILTSKN